MVVSMFNRIIEEKGQYWSNPARRVKYRVRYRVMCISSYSRSTCPTEAAWISSTESPPRVHAQYGVDTASNVLYCRGPVRRTAVYCLELFML